MIDLDDIDALAAEYVLGTLPAAERQDVAARRETDPALANAIAQWERRLGPLAEEVTPVVPSANLYNRIRAEIGLSQHIASLKSREVALTRRSNRWRALALGMTAMAATLAGVIVIPGGRGGMPTKYVAVLQTGDKSPAFLLTVDTETNMYVISAVNAPEPAGKEYQVWLVHDAMETPKSLGVFRDGEMDVRPMAQGKDHDMFMEATFAVSLEPQGGSPTGAPTGPVVFSGKLIKATP